MAKEDEKPQPKKLEVMAEPSRSVPKLTTKIAVANANGNTIISFLLTLPGEKAQLIERIVIDDKLTDELIALLKRTKEAKND